jgi:guanylate kinase
MTRLLVLAGPSGVGKGSVLAAARALDPRLWVSVSVTTRAPRPGEVDGEHYHFATPERFAEMVEAGELLEHATYAGASYGTPRAPVEAKLAAGIPSVLEIEVEGARQVRASMGERALLVFLAPPSFEELTRRLATRGTEDPAAVARRLAKAREELAAMREFDTTIVNDDVGDSARQLLDLWGG